MSLHSIRVSLLTLASAMILLACGGGSSSAPPPPAGGLSVVAGEILAIKQYFQFVERF